jgi:hypothetical protein
MKEALKALAGELEQLVDAWETKLSSMGEETITLRRNSQNRTIKQIVGHMVDSASNNTHRLVHMQYQKSPVSFPDYANLGNNDRWIAIQNYQDESWEELVKLWAAVNRHYIHVVHQVKMEKLDQTWISALGEEISLKEMILDYPRHFKLHLKEITELL